MDEAGVTFERLTTREAYRNPWLRVREDTFLRPDGSTGLYGVIDKPDFALVVPYEDGGFHLVEQYRYPVGERCWEFPLGGWPPGHAGGDPADLARAELAEETGFRAERIVHLGRLFVAPGVMSQRFHAFLATGLTPGEVAREESENDMRQTWVSRERFEEMVRAGTVRDSHSIAAYALFTLYERSGG
jgi:8-oxo-dGTP pyrophosphatase MutT (NUDIX family)